MIVGEVENILNDFDLAIKRKPPFKMVFFYLRKERKINTSNFAFIRY